MTNKKLTFALYFGNRGFFPGELIASARKELTEAVKKAGYDYILMDESATKYGAVETTEDGLKYAAFLKENTGKYDGVILSLPNFGDETGAVTALRDAGVPILIQAYRDKLGEMDFAHRRDSFCGKFSIMDMFHQYGIKYTAFKPHCVNPVEPLFKEHLDKFAAVCRVANGMKRFTIGVLGARTTAFKTVRYDELTLERHGITIESYDLSEVFSRTKKIEASRAKNRAAELKKLANFEFVPEEKLLTLACAALAIDDMITAYRLDAIAIRCWTEFQTDIGIAPCVLLGILNDRAIAAACETDVCNAVVMRALALASGNAATCLDWNNNYGKDEDNKCILFHCGPVPPSLMRGKGRVTEHKMFVKSWGKGCAYGTNEGLIDSFDFTYASSKTEDGKLSCYLGEGKFTDDKFDKEFFGCGGVAQIDNLQDVLLYVGRNGYRHHTGVTKGLVKDSVEEAFKVYLGYELKTF